MANIYYQVALVEAAPCGLVSGFQERLEAAFRDRGLDPDETLRFFENESAGSMSGDSPQIAVYFGGRSFDPKYDAVIERLLRGGTSVVPVVDTLDSFSLKVPEALRPINGLAAGTTDELEPLVALVLEELRLLRVKRRLFLSYKRSDSETAALQLYRHFDDRFFDPFLDTHGIRQGADFQEHLWHRMADSDVVVLLYTQNLFESDWVRQELGRAGQMGIRILQVIWPGLERDRRTEMFEPFYLEMSDFQGGAPVTHESRLKDAVLQRISLVVERLRARAMAARESRLLRPLCNLALSRSIPYVVRRAGSVDFHPEGPQTVRVCIGVGVPDATTFHEAMEPLVPPKPEKTFVLYDPAGIAAFHQQFLNWFFPFCPVGALTPGALLAWMSSL